MITAKDLIEARKNLNALASFTRGLLGLDAALSEIGDIDKLIAARQQDMAGIEALIEGQSKQIETKRRDLAAVTAAIEAAKNEIAVADQEAATIIERAKQDAADHRAQAQAAADATAEAARLEADGIRNEAKTYAEKLRANLQGARDELVAMELQAADAEARRDAANLEVARLRSVFGGQ